MINIETVKNAVIKKGYKWFEDNSNKGFDVNIVGIRNSLTGNVVTNLFDDVLTVSYKEKGVWVFKRYAITTEAGKKGVQKHSNPLGVATLIPNQYRSSYALGLHRGQYEALCQVKPVSVWRDSNKNLVFDHDKSKIFTGLFGINIHRSNPKTESQFVENWSEGCQVFKKVSEYNNFIDICKKAREIHGNSFSYTLLTTNDLL
jgi:hypothetical protein